MIHTERNQIYLYFRSCPSSACVNWSCSFTWQTPNNFLFPWNIHEMARKRTTLDFPNYSHPTAPCRWNFKERIIKYKREKQTFRVLVTSKRRRINYVATSWHWVYAETNSIGNKGPVFEPEQRSQKGTLGRNTRVIKLFVVPFSTLWHLVYFGESKHSYKSKQNRHKITQCKSVFPLRFWINWRLWRQLAKASKRN